MYYNIYYIVNEISRLIKHVINNEVERILNGVDVMSEEFCGDVIFSQGYNETITDTKNWIE